MIFLTRLNFTRNLRIKFYCFCRICFFFSLFFCCCCCWCLSDYYWRHFLSSSPCIIAWQKAPVSRWTRRVTAHSRKHRLLSPIHHQTSLNLHLVRSGASPQVLSFLIT